MLERAGWILEALQAVASRIGWSYGYRGSLFLIAGGIFVLGVLVIILLVQSTLFGVPVRRDAPPSLSVLVAPPARPVPLSPSAAQALAGEAAADPARTLLLGSVAGAALASGTLDSALDRFTQAGLGDPRVVVTASRRKVIRVVACRSCQTEGPGLAGCEYERGFLQGALGRLAAGPVAVHEVACRLRGDRVCDYEVVY